MQELPIYLSILFGLIVIASIIWYYFITGSKVAVSIIIGWAAIQSAIGISGIYQYTDAIPPRIMLFGMLPALIIIAITFLTDRGRALIDQINLKALTYFHSIRLPVEIMLTALFHSGVMSVYATFEGTNFDIFTGLTAPLVAYLGFKAGKRNKKLLLTWNIVCMVLLFNVVITAIFAVPSPFQKLAFDQPNIALLYFPFNLLPTLVVPLVLFGHLVAIRRLIKNK